MKRIPLMLLSILLALGFGFAIDAAPSEDAKPATEPAVIERAEPSQPETSASPRRRPCTR